MAGADGRGPNPPPERVGCPRSPRDRTLLQHDQNKRIDEFERKLPAGGAFEHKLMGLAIAKRRTMLYLAVLSRPMS